MPQNYLFLCAMGQNRSPTAAFAAKKIAQEKGLEIQMFYGGIDWLIQNPDINTEINKNNLSEHFNSYDKIFVMEKYMKEGLKKYFDIEPEKIICLNIPDEYIRNEPVLESILENILRLHIGIEDI